MQKKKNLLRNEEGFTLIEIIAVLIVLGVLAAVAVPKYIDLTTTAKVKAAEGQVAEIKSTLNLAYANYYIKNGKAPTTGTMIVGETDFTSGTAKDVGIDPDNWSVKLTSGTTSVAIAIISRGTPVDTGYAATGVWNLPS